MILRFLIFLICIAAANADEISISPDVQSSLKKFCFDCHDEDVQKGEVQLDNLHSLKLSSRLSLLNKIQEQIHFGEMPPKKKKQPTEDQRKELLTWVSKELEKYNASGLEEKLRKSEYGNYIDHNKLFSGDYAHLPGYTKDRRWLINEFIYNAKVNEVLDHQGVRTIDGVKRNVVGDNGVILGRNYEDTLRKTITNPFLLPKKIGVRYYDTELLTNGQLLTMMGNAKKIVNHMTSEGVMRRQYPNMFKIMELELKHKQIVSERRQFLEDHMGHILSEMYGNKNQALLPKFVSLKLPYPERKKERDGKPKAKRKDIGNLLGDIDRKDLSEIYKAMDKFNSSSSTFAEVIKKCEKEWFIAGVHPKTIEERIGKMGMIYVNWDLDTIHADAKNRNLKYPAYKPLEESEMLVVRSSVKKHRQKGDSYKMIIDKCLDEWEGEFKQERQGHGASEPTFQGLVIELYEKILERQPNVQELQAKLSLLKNYKNSLSKKEAISQLIITLLLDSEYVYRYEFGQGKADKHGRKMLAPRDASYALAYALTDSSPDEQLRKAAEEGRLSTREDYRREVERMLSRRDIYYVIDEKVQKAGFQSSITNIPIRKLRFFREFFGYTGALTLFKDEKRYGFGKYEDVQGRIVDEADMLVEYILKQDKNVFEGLLSTEEFYAYHNGNNEAMKAASDREVEIYNYFSKNDYTNLTQEEFYEKHWAFIDKVKMWPQQFTDFDTNEGRRKNYYKGFHNIIKSIEWRIANNKKVIAPMNFGHWAHKSNWVKTRTGQVMRGRSVASLWNIDYKNWDYPTTQPAKIVNRKGILTHPAWLIAHSLNLENDPVLRGKWVREKLLAGTIPDVPITVDAVVPEDHHKTLRQRLDKATGSEYCMKCHERMNPLGVTFEIYDDFGRFRTQERLEHEENIIKKAARAERGTIADSRPVYKTLPVNAKGALTGTGDSSLDGEVKDALELIDRLTKSTRVRQSIIRHAFRFFLGRNERLSDSKTLIDAEKAYQNSGGSFDAVIISLLTSDSFIYRKELSIQSTSSE